MPKHIFINSHDLDTSMIGAQLTGGKGRFADIEGTCFGYKFDFQGSKSTLRASQKLIPSYIVGPAANIDADTSSSLKTT